MPSPTRRRKIKLSIAIAAYNEASGIRRVLTKILRQQTNTVKLVEIVVACDGCTDKTAELARSLGNPLIRVIDDHHRMGKTKRLQQLFAECKGEVILMLDADIDLPNVYLLDKICQPFADEQVVLVGGNSRPAHASTFMQKAVLSTFSVFKASRDNHLDGNNLFGCTGSCLAIRGNFARTITFPPIVNEDAYLYFQTLASKLKFRYAKEAVITYKLPTVTSDYLKQVLRSEPMAVNSELQPYFDFDLTPYTQRDKVWLLKQVGKQLVFNPLGVSYVIMLNLLVQPILKHAIQKYSLNWFTAESTHS